MEASILHDAVSRRDVNSVNELLKSDPDLIESVDENGNTPLHLAVGGPVRLSEILIFSGAKMNAVNNDGFAPIDIALQNHVRNQGKSSAKETKWSKWCDARDFGEHESYLHFLSQHCTDENTRDNYRNTILHREAAFGNIDIVKMLIDSNMDVNSRNKFNETPLHNAVANNHVNVADLLVANGSDVSIRDKKGNTVFHLVGMNGNTGMFRTLTNTDHFDAKFNISDLDIENRKGEKITDIAESNGYIELIDKIHVVQHGWWMHKMMKLKMFFNN